MSYPMDYPIVAEAGESARAAFIRRTYGHLAGAILAFVGLEFALFKLLDVEKIIIGMSGAWILVLVAMMGAGWVAQYWARSNTSPTMQYAGLGLYVVAEAIIFLPLLYVAQSYVERGIASPTLIPTAGILTLAIFGGLTAAVFLTGRDYSHMAPILTCGGFLALGLIVCSIIFGFSLGLWFSFAMVALACGYIIYDTSNVLHHYRTDQHVGAALELFASVALLFFYILRILMANSSRD